MGAAKATAVGKGVATAAPGSRLRLDPPVGALYRA